MPGGSPPVKRPKTNNSEDQLTDNHSESDQSEVMYSEPGNMNYSVPTANQFAPLANIPTGTLTAPKVKKPQHFILPREKISAFANISTLVGLYDWRRERNGDMKILPKSDDAAALIKVEADKIGWYGHPVEKESKYVVYGLSPMHPLELLKKINSIGKVHANHVARMTLKSPLYPEQCNYIVYFAGNPTLPVLRESINNIDGAIPSWAHYHQNKQAGGRISRCTNCQKRFHGARNCHLKPVCGVCAGTDHQTSSCPLLIEKRNNNKANIHESLLKCANCGGNHTAGFSGCIHNQPRPKQWSKAVQPPRRSAIPVAQPFNINAEHFPELHDPRRQRSNYSSEPIIGENIQMSKNSNSSLFSIQEMQVILGEMLSKMRECKSKEDQFQLMFSLAAKYVYP